MEGIWLKLSDFIGGIEPLSISRPVIYQMLASKIKIMNEKISIEIDSALKDDLFFIKYEKIYRQFFESKAALCFYEKNELEKEVLEAAQSLSRLYTGGNSKNTKK